MKQENKYRIIIGGGGTGGHVFPAISIAQAVSGILEDVEFLFVGAKGKLEMEKVPEAGYRIVGLPVAGFQRKISFRNITFFFKLLRSMWLSRNLIAQFKPHLAIGVGGYASGPIVKAAARKGIPVLLQEQNSYAGVTNRILARSADKICVAYEGMEQYFPKEKIKLTGNPVRQDLLLQKEELSASLKYFNLDHGKPVILVIGGSLGARTINTSLLNKLSVMKGSGVQWIWQCGKYYHEELKAFFEGNESENIKLMPFIREMNRAYQVADVIISRAGAGTISELCIIGKPVILIPSPNVAEDHQTKNAKALSENGAAILIPDREAESTLVEKALELAGDVQQKKYLSENIKKYAIPDASERIAEEVKLILREQ